MGRLQEIWYGPVIQALIGFTPMALVAMAAFLIGLQSSQSDLDKRLTSTESEVAVLQTWKDSRPSNEALRESFADIRDRLKRLEDPYFESSSSRQLQPQPSIFRDPVPPASPQMHAYWVEASAPPAIKLVHLANR